MARQISMRLGQLNATVGAVEGNCDIAKGFYDRALKDGVNIAVLPEMFLSGYQAQDLVKRPAFVAHCERVLNTLMQHCTGATVLGIGLPQFIEGKLFNSYVFLHKGKVIGRILKHHLPHFNVFDEPRYFSAGALGGPVNLCDVRVGAGVCEDFWHVDVAETLEEAGAEILLSPNGSPYFRNKMEWRQQVMVGRVIETGLPLVYLNLVGGQDDQIFDGGSFVLNPGGDLVLQMPQFEEAEADVVFEETAQGWRAWPGEKAHIPDEWEADYRAMVEATRDYFRKTGFTKALVGLSGGIDSAMVAAIAADALGSENLRCVMLPSEYTSEESLEDAKSCAKALNSRYDFIPIQDGREAITNTLAPHFEGYAPDLTEENIQSRLRGLYLMAMSNKFGEMLLTTGNKSEVAVGYATIYGDMAGGYNPLKDLYKTRVFKMAAWRNAHHFDWMKAPAGEVIPQRIITKSPSAELRPDQKDEDSLPSYEVLDSILEMLIDQEKSLAEIVAAGHDAELVTHVEKLVYLSEYKRFQSAPGVRLTRSAFWLDRRYPIVNRWRDPSLS